MFSALPPKLGHCSMHSACLKVPRTDMAPYSITSSARQRRWDSETKRLGGLKVDRQLILGRRLHRKVGSLLALEDAIDVACRAPILIDRIRPVGDQATAGREVAIGVDRGQSVP